MSRSVPQRSQSFGKPLDVFLDDIIAWVAGGTKKMDGLNRMFGTTGATGATGAAGATGATGATGAAGTGETPMVFNDSAEAVAPFLIYGITDQAIARAASGAVPVEPLFQALTGAAPGKTFPVRVIGPARMMLADPSETVYPGLWGWLSPTSPGKVTITMPTSGRRYRVCQFASSLVDSGGGVSAHLLLFPQGGTAL